MAAAAAVVASQRPRRPREAETGRWRSSLLACYQPPFPVPIQLAPCPVLVCAVTYFSCVFALGHVWFLCQLAHPSRPSRASPPGSPWRLPRQNKSLLPLYTFVHRAHFKGLPLHLETGIYESVCTFSVIPTLPPPHTTWKSGMAELQAVVSSAFALAEAKLGTMVLDQFPTLWGQSFLTCKLSIK